MPSPTLSSPWPVTACSAALAPAQGFLQEDHQDLFTVTALLSRLSFYPSLLPPRPTPLHHMCYPNWSLPPSPKRSHHFPPTGRCFSFLHSLELSHFQFHAFHILAILHCLSVSLTSKEMLHSFHACLPRACAGLVGSFVEPSDNLANLQAQSMFCSLSTIFFFLPLPGLQVRTLKQGCALYSMWIVLDEQ